jgi:hypothetical protein
MPSVFIDFDPNHPIMDSATNDGIAAFLSAALMQTFSNIANEAFVGKDLTVKPTLQELQRLLWLSAGSMASEIAKDLTEIMVARGVDPEVSGRWTKANAAFKEMAADFMQKAGDSLNYKVTKSLGLLLFAQKLAIKIDDPTLSDADLDYGIKKELITYITSFVAEDVAAVSTFIQTGTFGTSRLAGILNRTVGGLSGFAAETAFGSRALAIVARAGIVGFLTSAAFEFGWWTGDRLKDFNVAGKPIEAWFADGIEGIVNLAGGYYTPTAIANISVTQPLLDAIRLLGKPLEAAEFNRLVNTAGKNPIYRPGANQRDLLDSLRAIFFDNPVATSPADTDFVRNEIIGDRPPFFAKLGGFNL